jgi:brefeldin A-resistance guanine nucleotide exchange factor 1
MYQTLFLHSLLPLQLTQEVDFLSGESTIPLKSLNTTAGREERKPEAGLLSTLSSYLLSPYTASNDVLTVPSEEDIENTLSAIDCVSSCKLNDLYGQVQ